MRKLVIFLLATGIAAGGALGLDYSRVQAVRIQLDTQTRLAADEAHSTIEQIAALSLVLTCQDGEPTRTLTVESSPSEVMAELVSRAVPPGCLLTNLDVQAVRLIPTGMSEQPLPSSLFKDGIVITKVDQTKDGAEVSAVGSARAGWFNRSIDSTATAVVSGDESYQEVKRRLDDVVEGVARQLAQRKTSDPLPVVVVKHQPSADPTPQPPTPTPGPAPQAPAVQPQPPAAQPLDTSAPTGTSQPVPPTTTGGSDQASTSPSHSGSTISEGKKMTYAEMMEAIRREREYETKLRAQGGR